MDEHALAAVETAVQLLGGPAATARTLKVTAPLIYQWRNQLRPVAPRHCIPIEEATDGKVTRYDLRPDVFGAPDDEKAANA
jgi:DNA-binding transcriptional regulator YdaS (Cro superfamily)